MTRTLLPARSSSSPARPSLACLVLLLCALWLCAAPCHAQSDASTPLLRGVMVLDTLTADRTTRQYTYRPSSVQAPVDVVLVSGCPTCRYHFHLFISTSPNPVYGSVGPVSMTSEGPARLRIAPTDALSCNARNLPLDACVYYIAVDNWQVNVAYAIAVHEPPVLAQLASGVATTVTVPAGGASYLYLINALLSDTVTLLLTVNSGDCDLFVSASNPAPSASNSTWRSDDVGDDLIAINAALSPLQSRPLYYYLGVVNKLPSASSTCTVIGSAYSSSNPSASFWSLGEGRAQRDVALANSFRYYLIYLTGVWDLVTITLSSLRGDADVYVNLGPFDPYGPNGADDLSWPNRTHAQYNSTRAGLDQINITGPVGSTYAFISIYSKAVDSHYSVTVAAGPDRVVALDDAVQGQALAQGRSAVYSWNVSPYTAYFPPGLDWRASFTLRTVSGNVDLYISDTYMRPNRTHCNWTSELAGDGLDIAILRTYALTQYGRPELSLGSMYYIAVYATTASVYSLYPRLLPRYMLTLNVVSSIYGYLESLLYAELDVPQGAEAVIRAIPDQRYGTPGNVTLFLSSTQEPSPDIRASYQLSGRETLRIAPVSSCPARGCRYYLAMQPAAAQANTYSDLLVTVTSPQVPLPLLLPGVPLDSGREWDYGAGMVSSDETALYRFHVPCSRATVRVAAVFHSPPLQLFGAVNPMEINRGPLFPLSSLNNLLFGYSEVQWTGSRTAVLSFNWTHPSLRAVSMEGEWLLSVQNSYSTYTLLLSVEAADCSPVQPEQRLALMMPQMASITAANGYAYFLYTAVVARNSSGGLLPAPLYFSVSSAGNASVGAAPALTLVARGDGQLASVESAQWRADGSGVLTLSSASCAAAASTGSCTYTLAVQSSAPSSLLLLASSVAGVRPLDAQALLQAPLAGRVAQGGVLAYAASVGNASGMVAPSSSISLVAEACMGAVSLWVALRNASSSGGAATALPSAQSNDGGSASVTSPYAVQLRLPGAVAASGMSSSLLASIGGVGTVATATSSYELRVLSDVSWADASPLLADSALRLTSYASTPSGLIRVRMPLASMPRAVTAGTMPQPAGSTTSGLQYSLYALDKAVANASAVNLRSMCGAQRHASLLYQAVLSTAGSTTVDVKPPRSGSSVRYTIVVHVEHVWGWRTGQGNTAMRYQPSTAAYATYTLLDDVRTGTQVPEPDDDDSSSGGDSSVVPPPPSAGSSSGALSGAVIIGLVLAALAATAVVAFVVQYWWHARALQRGQQQQKLQLHAPAISSAGLLSGSEVHADAWVSQPHTLEVPSAVQDMAGAQA